MRAVYGDLRATLTRRASSCGRCHGTHQQGCGRPERPRSRQIPWRGGYPHLFCLQYPCTQARRDGLSSIQTSRLHNWGTEAPAAETDGRLAVSMCS